MAKATFLFPFIAALLIAVSGCKKENSAIGGPQLHIVLTHHINNNPFRLNTTYTNHFGEDFTVTKFKYYLSNIVLKKGNKKEVIQNTYFLVDEASDTTKNISLPIEGGTYDGISFTIGVDSARNNSGAQTDALDPALDMFWTWNSGYIMAKMEGTSLVSTAPGHRIEYHIGGFKGEYNSIRTIDFSFTAPLQVGANHSMEAVIEADLQKWFDGVHPITIASNPASTMPSLLSSHIADNYSSMFYLKSAATK